MSTPLATEHPRDTQHDRLWEYRVKIRALSLLIEGKTISTADLHSVGEPSHPNKWGTIFKTSELRDYVECAGYGRSKLASRKGGASYLWRLNPEKRSQAGLAKLKLQDAYLQLIEDIKEAEGALF